MKNSVVLLAGGLAAMVTAQELSDCSRQCLDNMRGLATELECDAQLQGDELLSCLCKKQNYAYGVVDCTAQSCSTEESVVALQAAKDECARVGINWENVFTAPTGTPQASGTILGSEGTIPQTASSVIAGVTSGVLPSTGVTISSAISSVIPVETGTVISVSATDHHSQSGAETTHTVAESDAPDATGDAEATTTGADGDGSGAIRAAAPAMGVLIAAGVAAFLV
ncbi:hypothetical protein B0T11DRAFT_360448 [Plectosphaerella cucumerina]|uniref:CFEM domain-containing protein n=1 Tax=Plectosphaerella cucumerina TaxID=40658 RepID=A0A8K0TB30_9PEZI|nr:hypothetical protein B0T11DRAFT_360448 [Plectosphaerella cucumerina]